MKNTHEKIYWTFKKYAHFGFLIPENRDYYGGDFFINKHHDLDALDWQRVIWRELPKAKGKKPEAKIIELLWKKTLREAKNKDKTCTWVYVQTTPDFGFIEIPWKEKGYFVHSSKKWDAQNWDKVKATVTSYNGRDEAIVTEILKADELIVTWELKDNGDYGFVYTKKWNDDIFISASNYNGAVSWDTVQVRITKTWWRKPEWIVIKKKETE